jgi:hypothetical protein
MKIQGTLLIWLSLQTVSFCQFVDETNLLLADLNY